MDKRYAQSRFYNGERVAEGSNQKKDKLVRFHLARARQAANSAQSYGGSTGGVSSIDRGSGLSVIQARGRSIADAREIFKKEGSGVLGARAAFAEARNLPALGG